MPLPEIHRRIRAWVDAQTRTGEDFRGWTEETLALPEVVRVYHLTWLVEAEIRSGGLLHYFSNFWGDTDVEAVECYRRLGAPEHARVLAAAGAAADRASTEEEAARLFEPLDAELDELTEDSQALRERWVTEHRDDLEALLGQS